MKCPDCDRNMDEVARDVLAPRILINLEGPSGKPRLMWPRHHVYSCECGYSFATEELPFTLPSESKTEELPFDTEELPHADVQTKPVTKV